jgi:Protein of unknown function (DUF3795)
MAEIFPEPIRYLPEADIPMKEVRAYLSQSRGHQILFMQFGEDIDLDCFNCTLYEGNITSEVAEAIQTKTGVPKEEIACKGCRAQDGNHFHLPHGCATLDCVKAKGVELCCDCNDFPCAYLAPTADGAGQYPHNLKVYNLCRIKNVGLATWIEEAGQIRKTYFTGKFVMGRGQAD